ncbi:unnamed protein product, partial [Arabidopsis halleri]
VIRFTKVYNKHIISYSSIVNYTDKLIIRRRCEIFYQIITIVFTKKKKKLLP